MSLQVNTAYSDMELFSEIGIDGSKPVVSTMDFQVAIILDNYEEAFNKGKRAIQWTRNPVLEKNLEKHNKLILNHVAMNQILHAFRRTTDGKYQYLGEMKLIKSAVERLESPSGIKAKVTHTLTFNENESIKTNLTAAPSPRNKSKADNVFIATKKSSVLQNKLVRHLNGLSTNKRMSDTITLSLEQDQVSMMHKPVNQGSSHLSIVEHACPF